MQNKLLVLFLVLCLILVPVTAGADFGGFGGDSDFGSDWGGSDWGSSDWGSSDWGSSDWGSSSSDWGSSFGSGYIVGSTANSYSSSSSDMFYSLVMLAILVFVIVWLFRRRKDQNKPQGATPTSSAQLRPLSEYSELDPAFDAAALQEKLSNLYVQMQNAWTAKDISPLRPYFTDAYYAQMERTLNQLTKAGYTNYVERIAVLGVDIRGWMQLDDYDHMIVNLRSRIIDYTINDKTGELASGSQTREKFMTYEIDLSRRTGMKTEAQSGMHTVNCPNCGAPLNINTTAKCPYCDSIVTVEEHDWAISTIKGISQQTV